MVDLGLEKIPLRLWEYRDSLEGDGYPYISCKGWNMRSLYRNERGDMVPLMMGRSLIYWVSSFLIGERSPNSLSQLYLN